MFTDLNIALRSKIATVLVSTPMSTNGARVQDDTVRRRATLYASVIESAALNHPPVLYVELYFFGGSVD